MAEIGWKGGPPNQNPFPVYHGAGNKKQGATRVSHLPVPSKAIANVCTALLRIFFAKKVPFCRPTEERVKPGGVKKAPKDTDQAKTTANTSTW